VAETDRVFTAADVKAWRKGNWYFVTLAGELIFKRYTRDESFTEAWVLFQANQSPDHRKDLKHLDRVELRGAWPIDSYRAHWMRNRLSVPIERKKKKVSREY